MVTTFSPPEAEARGRAIGTLFKALERAHALDSAVLAAAISATAALSLPQLEAACLWLVRRPPKGPIIPAILESVDRATWKQQRDSEAGSMEVVPMICGATYEDVYPFREAAGYQWTPEELFRIREQIESKVPEVALYRRCSEWKLAMFRDHNRIPSADEEKRWKDQQRKESP